MFKQAHNWLIDEIHIHELPVEAIEMYYPTAFRKTHEEVNQMKGNKDKVNLALSVVESITSEEEFKKEMPVIYNALQKAIELAYE